MAETILRSKLKAIKVKDYKVQSAGIMCYEGQPMSDNAIEALTTLGYKVAPHKSRQFRLNMLTECELIITMTARHKYAIGEYPNVFTVDEIASTGEVIDPYGGDLNDYIECARELEHAIDILIQKMKF